MKQSYLFLKLYIFEAKCRLTPHCIHIFILGVFAIHAKYDILPYFSQLCKKNMKSFERFWTEYKVNPASQIAQNGKNHWLDGSFESFIWFWISFVGSYQKKRLLTFKTSALHIFSKWLHFITLWSRLNLAKISHLNSSTFSCSHLNSFLKGGQTVARLVL